MDTDQDVQQTVVGGAMAPIHTDSIEQELKGIATIQKNVRMQRVSPVEVVNACLKRIEEFNPELNAFITVLADQALEQARVAEAEIKAAKWRGPLHGIPVGIKDFYDTAGIKTTAAFEHFKDRVPGRDAVGVAKLKAAGAIIIGKMNMHRLGMGTTGIDSYYGPVHNPWNAEYIPGGSSAGSAVAVASGMCYATLDTDAIGSCRLPAACCGVVGFKGTYGLISTKGILDGKNRRTTRSFGSRTRGSRRAAPTIPPSCWTSWRSPARKRRCQTVVRNRCGSAWPTISPPLMQSGAPSRRPSK